MISSFKQRPTSFSLRLSIYILLVATLIFITAFIIYFQAARNTVQKEAIKQAQASLDNIVLQIDKVLHSIETTIHSLSWVVKEKQVEPDQLYTLTQQLLQSSPSVIGSAIAFEPNYYPEKGKFFSPYSYKFQGKIYSKQLGNQDYDYHYMDWYQIPKLLKKPYWSEPYYDQNGGDMIMTTYSFPLYDTTGNLYAIFTADLSLEWFAKKVNTIQLYPNSYNIMIGRGGTFLVHKRTEAILNETIFASPLSLGDKKLQEVGLQMIGGKRGMISFMRQGKHYYLFYAPITSTGWSVAIACLHSDIFSEMDKMQNIIILIGCLGLLLMTIFCYLTIRQLTTPLTRFANSAIEIAQGNFTVSLPTIHSHDEMKTLHNSFQYMQRSLISYMDELKQTTANKERIESELRIAHEIQMGMIPKQFPAFHQHKELNLYAQMIPAKEVGGDLYNYFIKDNHFYFIIGDVSGKGVPASLVMAVICHLFRTITTHIQNPAQIVTALNKALSENNESNMFCTAFIGILDLKNGHLKYCNAGHNAPIIITSTGQVKTMEVQSNIALGLFEDFSYQAQSCHLEEKSALFLFTDGVTEAEDEKKTLYSDERLLSFLSTIPQENPQTVIESVLKDIQRHVNGAEQSDDITMMYIYYQTQNMQKELILKNEITEINRLHDFVASIGEEWELSHDLIFNLDLVLEEAISNIILHAYPKNEINSINLIAQKTENQLIFVLTDNGKEFDPTIQQEVDVTLSAEERPIGGLGIFLIQQIMNKVEYLRIEGKNKLTLVKQLN